MQYHAIPCNTMQFYSIQCNTMQYHVIPCNTMQYYAIQCNTMQHNPALITADGAYHCPVGSIWLFLFQKSIRSGSHPSNLSTNISQSLIMILILVFVFFPGVEYPLIGRCGFTLAYYVSFFQPIEPDSLDRDKGQNKILFFLLCFWCSSLICIQNYFSCLY